MARLRGERFRPFFARLGVRLRRSAAESPLVGRVTGGLHRAATNLAEVTSEMNAYAGLLEEKAGELRERTRRTSDH